MRRIDSGRRSCVRRGFETGGRFSATVSFLEKLHSGMLEAAAVSMLNNLARIHTCRGLAVTTRYVGERRIGIG